MLILREILRRFQKRRQVIITFNSYTRARGKKWACEVNPTGTREFGSHRAPGEPCTARRMPYGCPCGLSFTPPARGHGCKESEKPRVAELKKATAGPKGRTLVHSR